jgi:hypothetical protein
VGLRSAENPWSVPSMKATKEMIVRLIFRWDRESGLSRKMCRTKRRFELLSVVLLVEREIQSQNVDARLAEHSEIAPVRILLNQFTDSDFT